MRGFETIGNATVICFDEAPVLATDPWLSGTAYFGAWGLTHTIPDEQLEHISRCPYLWLSHGHPDHLDVGSLDHLAGQTLLLPDHVGGRIERDLSQMGFKVVVLPDRVWVPLSKNIRVQCISDYTQDAILLIELNGTLLVNFNDAGMRGWTSHVKRTIEGYTKSYLLKKFGYADAHLINYWDEKGNRIGPPPAEERVGEQITRWCKLFGVTDIIPFSSFHIWRREDTLWAAPIRPQIVDYEAGFDHSVARIHPAFVRVDLDKGEVTPLNPPLADSAPRTPEECGDNWSDPLEAEDRKKITAYFTRIEALRDQLDFIRFRVGGTEHTVELKKGRRSRGVTFETPRASLMQSVEYEIFDDLLIANFVKATLHGRWGGNNLDTHFTPFVAKYADNGRARSKAELREYFRQYRQRDPVEFMLHRMERASNGLLRNFMNDGSSLYRGIRSVYRSLR